MTHEIYFCEMCKKATISPYCTNRVLSHPKTRITSVPYMWYTEMIWTLTCTVYTVTKNSLFTCFALLGNWNITTKARCINEHWNSVQSCYSYISREITLYLMLYKFTPPLSVHQTTYFVSVMYVSTNNMKTALDFKSRASYIYSIRNVVNFLPSLLYRKNLAVSFCLYI